MKKQKKEAEKQPKKNRYISRQVYYSQSLFDDYKAVCQKKDISMNKQTLKLIENYIKRNKQ